MTTLSAPLIRNRIPMRHSKSPKRIKNVGKAMKGITWLKRFSTTPLAGLRPITFKIPNQKKTTKMAKREKGMEILLKKAMALRSKDSNDMRIL
jgi:hypothetical protein